MSKIKTSDDLAIYSTSHVGIKEFLSEQGHSVDKVMDKKGNVDTDDVDREEECFQVVDDDGVGEWLQDEYSDGDTNDDDGVGEWLQDESTEGDANDDDGVEELLKDECCAEDVADEEIKKCVQSEHCEEVADDKLMDEEDFEVTKNDNGK